MNQNDDANTLPIRLSAVSEAVRLASNVGLVCPACILGLAKDIENFLRDGTVPDEHLGEDDDEGVVFTMDPETDPTKN